ncbi:MAG: type II secretion system protein [Planctomycetota bacterium]|nr:type II secretion system protein [Planctomycetota bacterium]
MQFHPAPAVASARPLPPGAGLGGAAPWRRAFSLVELLVVVSIILVLMALTGAAVSGARSSQKKQATQALIAKLDAVIQQQYASYGGKNVPDATSGDDRAVKLRQIISGDLPDRWVDVKLVAADPNTSHQRAYRAFWISMNPPPSNDAFDRHPDRDKFAGAECLFMIIMRGGIANCLDCSDLANERIGDKDGDGAFEFWDAWGNPIGFILWPGALELPATSGEKFFSSSPPFAPNAIGRTMRPLIYSAGPDGFDGVPPKAARNDPDIGWFGFRCNPQPDNPQEPFDTSHISSGTACGDPSQTPANILAAPLEGASDNITNFDAEAKR